jgi:YD repeat-containing protein
LAVLAVSFTTPPTQASTITYTYDDAGRLTEANYGDKAIKYTYDAAGNLLKREVTGTGGEGEVALYFPHVDTNSPWQTEIAVINTSADQALSGQLKAYSNSGQLLESISLSLDPHARRQIIVENEFTNPTAIGYITLETSSDTVRGYTKFYIEGIYRVAVPAVREINSSDIYVPHIDSSADWWTGLSLVNTTSSEKTITITFNTGEVREKTLPANGHEAFIIRSLFENQPQPDIKSAVITNANGIVGLELFCSTEGSGIYYLSGILLKSSTTLAIYYPHIDSQYLDPASNWWTGIVAYNPWDSATTITITPYNDTGTALATQQFSINPREKYIGEARDLSLPPATAWIKIESTNPITGFELFGTVNNNQLAGYTGVGISGKQGVFAKIEKYGWTGIAFVNIEQSQATITLTAYDDYGSAVASETISLASFAKRVDSAQGFFTQNIDSATYIAYSSDKDIVGFQLNGSSDDMMLDGLPGM